MYCFSGKFFQSFGKGGENITGLFENRFAGLAGRPLAWTETVQLCA